MRILTRSYLIAEGERGRTACTSSSSHQSIALCTRHTWSPRSSCAPAARNRHQHSRKGTHHCSNFGRAATAQAFSGHSTG